MMDRAALLVFAKAPVPGTVKTRLTGLLTEAEAAELYEAFLRDSLDAYRTLSVDVRLYLAGDAEALPPDLVPDGVTLHAQRGDGLGARMAAAFAETFVAGYGRVAIIGTDHPTLPLAFVARAFDELDAPLHVVIGPSDDGGFYLLGMTDLHPGLLDGMTYSHGAVFEQTLARAQRLAAQTAILPPWYDVDTPEALRRLGADLAAAEGGEPAAPCTRRVLARLRLAHSILDVDYPPQDVADPT